MYQEDHLTASRPPNKSRCRVLVGNYMGVCFSIRTLTRHLPWRIRHLGNIFRSKPPTQNCLVRVNPFLDPVSSKSPRENLLLWSSWMVVFWIMPLAPPRKQNKKLLCEGNSSSQTTFVLENMPLRTPPVAGRGKQALPRTQKLTSLWANEPGKFSSIYLLTEELFGTRSNPQNHKARPLTPLKLSNSPVALRSWPLPTVAGWSGLQVITVGGSADGEVEAQLYEATREGGFGILAGSRKKNGDFWLDPQKRYK